MESLCPVEEELYVLFLSVSSLVSTNMSFISTGGYSPERVAVGEPVLCCFSDFLCFLNLELFEVVNAAFFLNWGK